MKKKERGQEGKMKDINKGFVEEETLKLPAYLPESAERRDLRDKSLLKRGSKKAASM